MSTRGRAPRKSAPGVFAILPLLLSCVSHQANAQPTFAHCIEPVNKFNVSGTLRSHPCTQWPKSVTAGGGQFLFACFQSDVMLCDGDGSGPSPASCRPVPIPACPTIEDLALSAAADALYLGCRDQVLRCNWDAAGGTASGCTVLGQVLCPGSSGGGLERGIAMQGTSLVLACYSHGHAPDGGIVICPMSSNGTMLLGTCTKHGEDPCGAVTGQTSFKNYALSLDAAGGVSLGCHTDGAVYCSSFSTSAGPSGCAAPAPPSPCPQQTHGVARMPSGWTAVTCGGDGLRLCISPPSAAPSAGPTAPPAQPSAAPSGQPSGPPSGQPSAAPSGPPTAAPISPPSEGPTSMPSAAPTSAPASPPSVQPSGSPSVPPSLSPSSSALQPSLRPSAPPSQGPSQPPTQAPTTRPTSSPSAVPSSAPTPGPAVGPSRAPSAAPTDPPARSPSLSPSAAPSLRPSPQPAAPPSRAPTAHPTAPPATNPSLPPSLPPSADPSAHPSAAPSPQLGAPSKSPIQAPTGHPTTRPTSSPSAPPSSAPTPSPAADPSRSPTSLPSAAPTDPPARSPSLSPSAVPSLRPSPQPAASPSRAPTAHPTAPPATNPSLPPSLPPSAAPRAHPTQPPSRPPATGRPSSSPSRAPSGSPRGAPTRAPGPPGTSTTPPSPAECTPEQYRAPSGECVECSAERVAGGCPPDGGGFPSPSADGSACLCRCRFFWEGAGCNHCPSGYGGLDCDRCAVGGAKPPLCAPPQCADPASLPEEVVTECGGGAREVALQPALRHEGISAAVTITASSPAGAPRLSLPAHAPAQRLGGGGLRVEGAEAQLRAWLRLHIVPAATLTHKAPVTISVGITGSGGCVPISAQFSLRCPAPAPRESGALPAAAVPEGGEATVPCPLGALANMDDSFKVSSEPPGVVSYERDAKSCTINTAALPSPVPDDGTTAVVTVEAPGGEKVTLPLHIEINHPSCGSRVRDTLYVQLPPRGKGYESFGTIPLDELSGTFRGFGLVGSCKGITVIHLEDSLRVAASHDAVEGTFYVRLLHSAPGVNCTEAQAVRTFWGPGIVGPSERIRQPVGLPFEHVVAARALANVGSPPWCPDPVLQLAQQPGGLELELRATEWVLRGAIRAAGAQLAYISATDCRGGSAAIRVELHGVAGTELIADAATVYLEDTPLQLPFPRVLSTAPNLTLSIAPQLGGQLRKGVLTADCPAAVIAAQGEPGLALQLSGPPRRLVECRLTLTPAKDVCDNLGLIWRAAGAALEQLLPGVCAPDPPVATPRTRNVRWGDYVEAHISSLAHTVDRDKCVEHTTARNVSRPWLKHTGAVIAGHAPSEEVTQCRTVNAYTCQTALSAVSYFCATSLPDARMRLSTEVVECVEDTPCWLHRNITMEPTALSRNDTPVSLVFSSNPSVLRELRFNASPADAPDVQPSGEGEVRADDRFKRLWQHMHKAQVVVAPDIDGVVNITVRGAVGTVVGEAGPLTIRFAPVNDAPRCSGTCQVLPLKCGMLSGGEEDLNGHFKDVDDAVMGFSANSTSFGVRVAGNVLRCSSILALITFYGIPLTGSAKVYATDPSGAVSPPLTVKVEYELTESETVTVLLLTIAFSVYGTFLLIFRPGSLAAVRSRRRSLGGGRRPRGMVCRVGREAAEQLQAAQIGGIEVFQAGCGQWWLCNNGGITNLADGLSSGEIAELDIGGNYAVVVQPESAFDPGSPLFCAVISVRRLSLGRAPRLSVLHEDPEAQLKLCIRLRHKRGGKAGIVWAAGITRLMLAACSAGPEYVEYTGTAQQVTEFAHMQRVVAPAGCSSELVWTLREANSGRALLGGAIPVNAPEVEAAYYGGEGAASPSASSPAAAAAAVAPSADPESSLHPLMPVTQQQRQGGRSGSGRPRTRRDLRRSATALELQEMEQRLERRAEQLAQEVRELRFALQFRGGSLGKTPSQSLLTPRSKGGDRAPSSASSAGPLSPSAPDLSGYFQGSGGLAAPHRSRRRSKGMVDITASTPRRSSRAVGAPQPHASAAPADASASMSFSLADAPMRRRRGTPLRKLQSSPTRPARSHTQLGRGRAQGAPGSSGTKH